MSQQVKTACRWHKVHKNNAGELSEETTEAVDDFENTKASLAEIAKFLLELKKGLQHKGPGMAGGQENQSRGACCPLRY